MRTLRSVLMILAACIFLCGECSAQPAQTDGSTNQPNPAFEVVSIREVDSTPVQIGPGSWRGPLRKSCEYSADRVQCQLGLDGLISEAYQLKRTELAGPDWLKEKVFAFQATIPLDTTQEAARHMLQRALEERFGLKAHREKREISVYALVIGKDGPRLEEAGDPKNRKGQMLDTLNGKINLAGFCMPGHYFSMAITLDDFARDLNMQSDLQLPVMNLTGLTGEYRIDLKWSPNFEEIHNGHDPGFVRAVQQLGLRLEKRKVAYNVLVIDHVERQPTEN